jgi:hypothetical protein
MDCEAIASWNMVAVGNSDMYLEVYDMTYLFMWNVRFGYSECLVVYWLLPFENISTVLRAGSLFMSQCSIVL